MTTISSICSDIRCRSERSSCHGVITIERIALLSSTPGSVMTSPNHPGKSVLAVPVHPNADALSVVLIPGNGPHSLRHPGTCVRSGVVISTVVLPMKAAVA